MSTLPPVSTEVAQKMQVLFRESVKAAFEGDIDSLTKSLEKFLTLEINSTATEFFSEFKSEGKSILHIACSGGNVECVKFVAENLGDKLSQFINTKDDNGVSPLLYATIAESDASIEFLLSKGADVNTRNNDGATPLHFAAADGNFERCKLLVNAGSKLNVLSSSGSALHWAAGKARGPVITYLLEASSASNSNLPSMKIDVNATNNDGVPPVLMAAASSCDEGVCSLVKAGADIGMVVSGNLTTLHICCENGLVEAVRTIIKTESGKKLLTIKTNDGYTPIILAGMSKYRDIVKELHSLSPEFDEVIKNKNASEKSLDEKVDVFIEDCLEKLKTWEDNYQKEKERKEKEEKLKQESIETSETFQKRAMEALLKIPDPKKSENENGVTPTSKICPYQIDSDVHNAAEEFKKQGNEFFSKNDFVSAIEYYTKAIELNKFEAAYWSNRSAAHLHLAAHSSPDSPLMSKDDHARAALVDAEICRRLRPEWTRGCLRLAKARLRLEFFEDAALAAFEGVKLNDKDEELKAILQQCVKKGQNAYKKSQNK